MMRQSFDTENEAVFNSSQDQFYQNNHQGQFQQPHQDNDGLYRAVMVAPSVITGNASTGARSSPAQQHLSATNLYSQYLSQYELNQPHPGAQVFYGPTGSYSDQQQQQPQQQLQQTLVYGNPGFVCSSGDLPIDLDQYDDHSEVFHHQAQHRQLPLTTDSTIYGVQTSPSPPQTSQAPLLFTNPGLVYHSAPPMQLAPPAPSHQPIYGMTVAAKNGRWGVTTPGPVTSHPTQTSIRCSPDEGYGEESSTGPSVGQLEGTEV